MVWGVVEASGSTSSPRPESLLHLVKRPSILAINRSPPYVLSPSSSASQQHEIPGDRREQNGTSSGKIGSHF